MGLFGVSGMPAVFPKEMRATESCIWSVHPPPSHIGYKDRDINFNSADTKVLQVV